MSVGTSMDDPRATASLLRWWVDAGVDVFVDEMPQPWLAQPKIAPEPQQEAATTPSKLPDTLAQLQAWLLQDPSLVWAGPSERRVAPIGVAGCKTMIITDMPSHEDVSAKSLFSGEEGVLLDSMLKAVQLTRGDVYCAPLNPGRPATGQLDAEYLDRMGEIMRHHIMLAAPKRVWILGQTTSRAVLGADVTGMEPKLHNINHDGGMVAAIASFHPKVLLQHPKRKAKVWSDMQMLFGGKEA